MLHFQDNPNAYKPSGKSEIRAIELATNLAVKLGYTVSGAALNYSQVLNLDVMIKQLEILDRRYEKGPAVDIEAPLKRYAATLNLTLTKA